MSHNDTVNLRTRRGTAPALLTVACALALTSCASASQAGGQPSPSEVRTVASQGSSAAPGQKPGGCLSGTAAIIHRTTDPALSKVCASPGTRLRVTLMVEGTGGWNHFKVIPQGAVTVAYTTDSADEIHAAVSPAGTKNFCLSAASTGTTGPVYYWLLCVTIHR